jgi:excisionase family DNA binding protein
MIRRRSSGSRSFLLAHRAAGAPPGPLPRASYHHPPLGSLADAADALAVSTRTIRRYIADGQLEAVRLGRRTLRIKVDSIERFIDARRFGNWR